MAALAVPAVLGAAVPAALAVRATVGQGAVEHLADAPQEAAVPAVLVVPSEDPAVAVPSAAPEAAASAEAVPAALEAAPGAGASAAGAEKFNGSISLGRFLLPGEIFWTYPPLTLHKMEATDTLRYRK